MRSIPRFIAAMMVALVGIVPLARSADSDEPRIDPEADQLLKAMCAYIADAKSYSVKLEVWRDEVLSNGVTLQTTRNLEVQQRRPNQLHVEVRSPRISRGFWYREKSLTILDRNTNLYGMVEAPDSLEKTIDEIEDKFGIEIPLGDLLVPDPYQGLMENVHTGINLGKVSTLGATCNHLAFFGANADFQVWITDGPRPLPRKIVINYHNATEGTRQLTQIFSEWDLVTPIADSAFVFAAPQGASQISIEPKKPVDAKEPPAAPSATEKK